MTSLSQSDIAHHVHPQTNLHHHGEVGPFVLTRGEGVFVYDDDDSEYLDGLAGLWSASLGFSERRLADAAYAQMTTLPYSSSFSHRAHPPIIALAEKLMALAPPPLTRAFFASSGSEAIDTAIKLVWYYHNAIGKPEKKKIVAREKAYHGSTIMSGSLTGLPRMHGGFDLPVQGVVRVPAPHFWRAANEGEAEAEFCTRIVRETCDIILREDPVTVGAFFAEPLQGAGGVILPPEGYHAQMQAFCREHDILYVVDEVVCGFGRTGNMWGSETYGLKPDMATTAKALSASYAPISALMVSDRIFEAMQDQSKATGQFGHGFTYSGHPVCAAVALETLAIYEELNIVQRVRDLAPVFQDGLRQFADHPAVGEVRGIGLIAGVELVADKASRQSYPADRGAGAQVQAAAQKEGLLIRALGDTLAFCPPLIIDENQIEMMCERFGRALDGFGAKPN